MIGPTSQSWPGCTAARLPSSQKTMSGSWFSGSATNFMIDSSAVNRAVETRPPNTKSRMPGSPTPRPPWPKARATITPIPTAAAPPAKVSSSRTSGGAEITTATAAPNPAPASTPSRLGETRGLRNTDW